MSSNLSVAEVLASLEQRAAFHRDQEAMHAQQETQHREERALHAAELAKVLQSLEAFREVASVATELAQPVAAAAAAKKAEKEKQKEEKLPPPGRLMVGRLLTLVVQGLAEPFGPTAVAVEANRRFADRLRRPVGTRTASDLLRRLLAEGTIRLAQKGTAFHEALYTRRG